MDEFVFEWNEDKNNTLKETFGIGFEDLLVAMQTGNLLSDDLHFTQIDYPHQRVYIVNIDNYAYVMSYVADNEREIHFLKTFYPSRKHTKLFIKL